MTRIVFYDEEPWAAVRQGRSRKWNARRAAKRERLRLHRQRAWERLHGKMLRLVPWNILTRRKSLTA